MLLEPRRRRSARIKRRRGLAAPASTAGGLSFDGLRPRTRTRKACYDRARGRDVIGVALDDPFLEGLMAGYTLWVDEPLTPGGSSSRSRARATASPG